VSDPLATMHGGGSLATPIGGVAIEPPPPYILVVRPSLVFQFFFFFLKKMMGICKGYNIGVL
jgi:hypothetical protein